MAHPARQVFQHIINRDAKSSDAWLPSALSRLQSDEDGSAPVFPGEVIVVNGFMVVDIASCAFHNISIFSTLQ